MSTTDIFGSEVVEYKPKKEKPTPVGKMPIDDLRKYCADKIKVGTYGKLYLKVAVHVGRTAVRRNGEVLAARYRKENVEQAEKAAEKLKQMVLSGELDECLLEAQKTINSAGRPKKN